MLPRSGLIMRVFVVIVEIIVDGVVKVMADDVVWCGSALPRHGRRPFVQPVVDGVRQRHTDRNPGRAPADP